MKKPIHIPSLLVLLTIVLPACGMPARTTPNPTQQPVAVSNPEIQAASTPPSAVTVSLPVGMPNVETDFGKMLSILQSGKFSYIENLAAEKYNASPAAPGTQTYTVTFPAGETVYLQYGWCAKDAATLQQNIQHIGLIFYFNDQQIPNQYVTSLNTRADNGWECTSGGMLLSGWQTGSYHFRTVASFDEKINDGASDYDAGDYITDYYVTVK